MASAYTPAYIHVARVARAHGRFGEVVVVPLDGLPFCLEPGMTVWPTPPALRGPHGRRVVSVRGTRAAIVALEGVETLDDAEGLVGKLILARRADVPAAVRASLAVGATGREVIDERRGSIGTVVEVMELPANDVWRVEGPFGEVLVPVIDDVVGEIAPEGPLRVRLLDGLIDDGADPA